MFRTTNLMFLLITTENTTLFLLLQISIYF